MSWRGPSKKRCLSPSDHDTVQERSGHTTAHLTTAGWTDHPQSEGLQITSPLQQPSGHAHTSSMLMAWKSFENPLSFTENSIEHTKQSNQTTGSVDGFKAQHPEDPTLDEVVCFGEINGLLGKYGSMASPKVPVTGFPVRLTSADQFSAVNDDSVTGTIHPDFTHLTFALLDEPGLDFQSTCFRDISQYPGGGKQQASKFLTKSVPCSISIIIYGTLDMFNEIGEFFQTNEVYLQDPKKCDINVRYCNPHRLSSAELDSCRWTFELQTEQIQLIEMSAIEPRPDLLDIMNSHEDLPETPQPVTIQTSLKRHQKQALTFMHQRELGWALDGSRPDIWEYLETGQGQFFMNHVSAVHQEEPPEDFHGGIIADPMGLGKTLTMIALVASDAVSNAATLNLNMHRDSNQTLIIVPPPLLDTWEEQLREHIVPGSLTWYRHHGKTKVTADLRYQNINIVLTTYHTVSADWKSHTELMQSILFSTRWKRVILDEAHFIRNSASQMTQAVCALDAVSRWAVTGTPIQNRLSDMAALLKFLRVYPYSDKRQFEADISNVWKGGDMDEAIKRLKRLAGCLILRRNKNTISLPPRRDLQCPTEFSVAEREVYNGIRNQVIARIDDLIYESNEDSKPYGYVNILQQIEAMRMVCNLGLHYHGRHQLGAAQRENSNNWQATAQQAFNFQREMGGIQCQICSTSVDVADGLLDETRSQRLPSFSECLQFVCSDCVVTMQPLNCGHKPPCLYVPVSINPASLEETSVPFGPPKGLDEAQSMGLPSKVTALVSQLNALPSDVKSVVFSTWRTTLDVIETGLHGASIKSLRFDGKVPQKDRHNVIERFRKDPEIRVLLLTLSCGAVGLTLTAASYAFLIEPHWNPTLEDQALARIHRLGQKREVTTVRFYVRDSFEQHVIEVQESKRQLANVLLAPHDPNKTGRDMKSLQDLRALL